MNEVLALHIAARRYCRTRHDEYWEAHGECVLRAWHAGTELPDEPGVYSRFLVLRTILEQVEQLPPSASSTAHSLREALVQIGTHATGEFLDNVTAEAGLLAIREERHRFIEYCGSLSKRDLAAVKPLPHLRVLAKEEEQAIWTSLASEWGVDGAWYPLVGSDPPPHTLAFHTDYFDASKIETLRQILSNREIRRVVELRWSISFEIDLSSFNPCFERSQGSDTLYGAGQEGFWVFPGHDGFVFASHEKSITLTGEWLIAAFRNAVPACDSKTYLGQIATPDGRGRWSRRTPDRILLSRPGTRSGMRPPPCPPEPPPRRLWYTCHMRKTLTIDDKLLQEAQAATEADSVRLGREALVRHAAYQRLRELPGSEPDAIDTPRRRQ